MERIDLTNFDHLYPGPNERFMCDHRTLKLSAHIQPHVEPDRYFITIYDFESMSMTAIKELVCKADVYLFIKMLVPELMNLEDILLNSRPTSPLIGSHNPDYQRVLSSGGQLLVMEYGPDDLRNEFEMSVLANIPCDVLLDPERN